jgi:hypothetical protein
MRQEFIESVGSTGSVELVEGPFGTEIRRTMQQPNPQGKMTTISTRDWLIEGPAWMVNVRFSGKSAHDISGVGPMLELEEFVRNLIVRRGTSPALPGKILTLTPPVNPNAKG